MAAKRFEMFTSGAVTASGNSAPFALSTGIALLVGVDVTAISGTGVAFSLWLQASDDGGTTWYDVPYDLRYNTRTTGADVAANKAGDGCNINGTSTWNETQDPIAAVAIYRDLPSDVIRLKWALTGTTPSVTFSASAVTK